MGRPVNKRYFGSGSGDQIKVRAKVGANAEGDGFIVKQRGTKKFIVTVGGNTGTCTLVNKSTGALADNEMIVNVRTDAGTTVQATKLFNRVVIVEDGTKVAWNFEAIDTDESVEVLDVEQTVFGVITIDTDVTDETTVSGAVSFVVAASTTGGGTVSYQWQESIDGSYVDVDGETTGTLALTGLTLADDGRIFRAEVNSTTAPTVYSAAGTLTFGD